MKTILSAAYANTAKTCVVLDTQEAGSVLLDLTLDYDNSGGWRAAWEKWDGETEDYVAPVEQPTVEAHFETYGYSMLALVNLLDLSTRIETLPQKASSVREWITDQQTRFALGQTLGPAPHTYQEVLEELAPLLSQP